METLPTTSRVAKRIEPRLAMIEGRTNRFANSATSQRSGSVRSQVFKFPDTTSLRPKALFFLQDCGATLRVAIHDAESL